MHQTSGFPSWLPISSWSGVSRYLFLRIVHRPILKTGFFQVSDNLLPRPFANANSAGVGFGMFSNYHKSKSDSTLQPLGCLEAFASTKLRLGELGDIWEVRSK
jgi:hypothetical protein